MHLFVELLLFVFLILTALAALELRNLLAAVVTFAIYSFLMALLLASMGAVDVGFTEAVVGAGIAGVFFIATLYRTTRRSRS
jgi:energy-converting hydrogenase B subunit D